MPAAAPASPARHALVPLSIVLCFVAIYALEAPPLWLAGIGVPLAALYLAAPSIGRRSLAAFDGDAARLQMRGQGRSVLPRFGRAWGMRLFAPPAEVAERKGRAEALRGQHGRARAAYRAAAEAYGDDAPPPTVLLGLAHASYALGDDREAIARYREILRGGGTYPRVARSLAHALARRAEDLDDAEALAERALKEEGDAPTPEAQLVRALVHARRGEAKQAKKLLRATRRADDVDRLREEVETALA